MKIYSSSYENYLKEEKKAPLHNKLTKIYDKFPVHYGTPYPEDLMQKIDERINYLNKQHQKFNKRLG